MTSIADIHPTKKYIIKAYGKEPETLDELANCVIAVITARYKSKAKLLGFAWSLTWTERVSNSHSCPLNGVTNWGFYDESQPDFYPGWVGRVWFRTDNQGIWSGSDVLSQTLTHTGTGGAGSYNGPWSTVSRVRYERHGHLSTKNLYPRINCYSYDYRIFEDDWPELKRAVEVERVWHKIANTKYIASTHKFVWEDMETKIKDTEFINETQNLTVI